MSDALELDDARVSHIEWLAGVVRIRFSQVCIHKSTGRPGRDPTQTWSQEAELVMLEAAASAPLPSLPTTVAEGFLEVGGIRHELIPLPFRRKVDAHLHLKFSDGALAEITGKRPSIELAGTPVLLGDA